MSEPTPITAWFISRVVSRSRNRYAGALNGTVEGRGHIITTPIVSIKGRTVTTRSGTVYRLVGPDLWGRKNSHRSHKYPFYLDTPGADVWPVGATVPELGADNG